MEAAFFMDATKGDICSGIGEKRGNPYLLKQRGEPRKLNGNEITNFLDQKKAIDEIFNLSQRTKVRRGPEAHGVRFDKKGTVVKHETRKSSLLVMKFWFVVEETPHGGACGSHALEHEDKGSREGHSAEDSNMFPGRGRTLGSGRSQTVSTVSSDSSLEARLLDNGGSPNHPPATGADQQIVNGRQSAFDGATAAAAGVLAHHQGSVVSEEEIQNLVAMGFERTQVEVAVAAADGDLNVAVEILMSQLKGKILVIVASPFDTSLMVVEGAIMIVMSLMMGNCGLGFLRVEIGRYGGWWRLTWWW
ncbi:hypothetical protein TEA_002777 [Camellia sinensis var. sinensis]|uniref:UBA domain-containing protein n=1 Tax=Camellia sinensis var. sinensis TaxID=542762 RepID=A0A4S4D3I2_CAMSN|nr:hypothetical protein TEA_002777 [Camellia sinensis var. sinensis]